MTERRNFARVEASLYFSYKQIDEAPTNWHRTSTVYLTKNYVDIPVHSENFDSEAMFKLLYAALGEIKDDIREMKQKLGVVSKPAMEISSVNLSGSGIGFYSDKALKQGDLIKISLVLPLELPILVKVVGEVVENPYLEDENRGQLHNIRFVAIDDDDRELIIKYTFKR